MAKWQRTWKQRWVTEFIHTEKFTPSDIYKCLQRMVDMSTVSNVFHEWQAINQQNEECFNQLICLNWAMKDKLHRQNFPNIMKAVKTLVASSVANFHEHSRQALLYHWWKYITSIGDYVKNCNKKLVLSNGIIVLYISMMISIEINKRHYFWSTPHI